MNKKIGVLIAGSIQDNVKRVQDILKDKVDKPKLEKMENLGFKLKTVVHDTLEEEQQDIRYS